MSDTTDSLRRTINSGAQLQSVVRTMKALAASNIGQYEQSVSALADYSRTVQWGLGACLRQRDPSGTAQRTTPAPARETAAIVFGSDQGLVGRFNDIVADHAIKTLAGLPGKTRIWTVGERVHARLTDSGLPLIGPLAVPSSVGGIAPLIDRLQIETEVHRASESAQLWIIFNRPVSAAAYEPTSERLLPLDAPWQDSMLKLPWPGGSLPQIIGGGALVLRYLVREYLFISLFRACAESLASENASRLAAMQRADKNIEDLLRQLNARFNQLRQSSIDEELFDVVSGFEALVGAR